MIDGIYRFLCSADRDRRRGGGLIHVPSPVIASNHPTDQDSTEGVLAALALRLFGGYAEGVQLEQFFQPFGIVFDAAAEIDAFQHLVVAFVGVAQVLFGLYRSAMACCLWHTLLVATNAATALRSWSAQRQQLALVHAGRVELAEGFQRAREQAFVVESISPSVASRNLGLPLVLMVSRHME